MRRLFFIALACVGAPAAADPVVFPPYGSAYDLEGHDGALAAATDEGLLIGSNASPPRFFPLGFCTDLRSWRGVLYVGCRNGLFRYMNGATELLRPASGEDKPKPRIAADGR